MDQDVDDCRDAISSESGDEESRLDKSGEDILDLYLENDLARELSISVDEDSVDQEEKGSKDQEEKPEKTEESSLNDLHETVNKDKESSNGVNFDLEQTPISPPTLSIMVPNSLENRVPQRPQRVALCDRFLHGRRGKRGVGRGRMSQIRPNGQLSYALQFPTSGNKNYQGGEHRLHFQRRGGSNRAQVPNVQVPRNILANPHFQGAVQPAPGSGRLIWYKNNVQDPVATPPAVHRGEHTDPECRPLQGRPDQPAPWTHPQQARPSPWLKGFEPETSHKATQQYQQQRQSFQNNQQPQQNASVVPQNPFVVQQNPYISQPNPFCSRPNSVDSQTNPPFVTQTNSLIAQRSHQRNSLVSQPTRFEAQLFPQTSYIPREICSNEMELERVRIQERRRINHELTQRMDLMAPPVPEYGRQATWPRSANSFGSQGQEDLQGPSAQTLCEQLNFSAPPPSNADFYPRPSVLFSRGSDDMTSYCNYPRQGFPGHQLPSSSTQPPPMQHKSPPGLQNWPKNSNNRGPATYDEQQFRPQRPQLPYRSPAHSVLSGSLGFTDRQTIDGLISHDSSPPPQLLSLDPFAQPNSRLLQMPNCQRSRQMRLAAGNFHQAEPNRHVMVENNQEQVLIANESVQRNFRQLLSINAAEDCAQQLQPSQVEEPRVLRQQITTQQAGPSSIIRQPRLAIERQLCSLVQMGRSTINREQGTFIQQHIPSFHEQGLSSRQNRPIIRQKEPCNRQQGLNQPGQQEQVLAGPALRLVTASKRHQSAAEEGAKRSRVNASEEAEDRSMVEIQEEENLEMRNYRLQMARQKKLRDAILLTKEIRRQQAARERLNSLEQQQEAVDEGDHAEHYTGPN